ncbi:MAG: hypothetical protein R3F30_13690 [Planctomycetota bacterium]
MATSGSSTGARATGSAGPSAAFGPGPSPGGAAGVPTCAAARGLDPERQGVELPRAPGRPLLTAAQRRLDPGQARAVLLVEPSLPLEHGLEAALDAGRELVEALLERGDAVLEEGDRRRPLVGAVRSLADRDVKALLGQAPGDEAARGPREQGQDSGDVEDALHDPGGCKRRATSERCAAGGPGPGGAPGTVGRIPGRGL